MTIKNCNVVYSTSSGAKYSVSFTNVNDSILENNTFIGGINSIYFSSSSNVTVRNNTLNSTGGDVIYLLGNSDNNLLLENNIVEASSDGIKLESSGANYPENNKISGNNFSGIGGIDLNLASEGINGTNITGQNITNYSFSGAGALLSFGNAGEKGLIQFLDPINGSGTNLSKDIGIDHNFISVDSSSKPGLDKRATLTFYDISVTGTPTIVKNGGWCDDGECTDFGVDGSTYSFTVDSFSNYSVGNLSCADKISSGVTLGAGMSCDYVAVEFDAANIGVDCNGYSVNFSDKGSGNAFLNDDGHSNITIRNCNIKHIDSGINYDSAIFFSSGADEVYIYNNTLNISTGPSGNRIWGIYVNDSSNISVLDNNLTANYSTVLVSSIYARNSRNLIIMGNMVNTTGAGHNGISLNRAGDGDASNYTVIGSNIVDVGEGYGIRGAIYTNITNNKIDSGNVGLDSGSNSTLLNNTVFSNSTGIELGSYCVIENNTIISKGYGGFLAEDANYNNLSHNVFNSSGEKGYGSVFSGAKYNIMFDNNITTTNCNPIAMQRYENCHGISFREAEFNRIENNTFEVRGRESDVFHFYTWSYNNSISNNNIIFSQSDVIKLGDSAAAYDNNFTNNSFNNVYGYDFNISGYGANRTYLIDQPIGKYYIANSTVYFKDTNEGEIRFLDIIMDGTMVVPVGVEGDNLSSEIMIGNNSIFVDSSVSGLDKAANLTFYNIVHGISENITAYRNDSVCPATICGNLTNISNTYFFNVTGFTTYRLGNVSSPQLPAIDYDPTNVIRDSVVVPVPECSISSDCSLFYERCIEGECVKLLDVKILRTNSPVKPGGILDFTYSIESPYDLEGDFDVRYWIQKAGVSFSPEVDSTCGNNIKEGFEGCDFGDKNAVESCVPEYGSNCTYCDLDCNFNEVIGDYCGDSSCNDFENVYNCQKDCGSGNYWNRFFYFILDFFRFTGFASADVEGQDSVFVDADDGLVETVRIPVPDDLLGEYELHIQVDGNGYVIEDSKLIEVSYNVPVVVDALVGDLENLLSPAEFELSLFSNVAEEVSVKVREEISDGDDVVWSQARDVLVDGELNLVTSVDLDYGEYDYMLTIYYDDEVYESSSKISIVELRKSGKCSEFLRFFYPAAHFGC